MMTPPDSLTLVLKEIEQVHQLQMQSGQRFTSRAGTVLTILIAALTATVTVAGAVAHPPIWAIAIPGALLVSGALVSAWAFTGSSVGMGPGATSLKALVNQPERETMTDLVDFYEDMIADNRHVIERQRIYLQVSLSLLLATVAAVVVFAVILY